jgi:hypothetical protein
MARLSVHACAFKNCLCCQTVQLQFVYKGLYLLAVAIPLLADGKGSTIPVGIAVFFVVWEVVLPFAIPWKHLFHKQPGEETVKVQPESVNKQTPPV